MSQEPKAVRVGYESWWLWSQLSWQLWSSSCHKFQKQLGWVINHDDCDHNYHDIIVIIMSQVPKAVRVGHESCWLESQLWWQLLWSLLSWWRWQSNWDHLLIYLLLLIVNNNGIIVIIIMIMISGSARLYAMVERNARSPQATFWPLNLNVIRCGSRSSRWSWWWLGRQRLGQ